MKKFFTKMLAFVAALFIAGNVYAQVTTSALSGVVLDDQKTEVVGAAVLATHTPSGTTYWGVTNANGVYSIEGMRPGGPYTVEFSILGYQTLRLTDVMLSLGETIQADAELSPAAELLDEVVVSATTTKFNTERTGPSLNIRQSDITTMPTISRSISDIAKLSPYANGMSFAGGDGRSTNFTVDGANLNNNFGLSSNLPGGGNPISLDAIEEIQVVIAPFDVRQSNFIGGGVNAITKSGTNTFKATGYTYFQNQDTQGWTINGERLNVTENSKKVYGFTVGGPIWKNHIFFFVNYETTTQPGQVISYRANKGGEEVKGNVSRTTEEDLQKVQDFLKTNYGYDTGSYTSFPGDESNSKFLARLDWNISQNHKLSLRYNTVKNLAWNAPNGNSSDTGYRLNGTYRVGAQSMSYANTMYSMQNNVSTISGELNSRFGNHFSNQLLVTYSSIEDIRGSNSEPFPMIDIMTLDPSDTGLGTNPQPYISAGYELFTWNNGVHNKVWTAKDDLTFTFGNHKTVVGVNYEHQFANNAYMRNGTMYYRYKSLDDFLNSATPESFAITYGWNGEANPNAQVTFNQIGVYAQDEWKVTPKFKLSYGVRFDELIFDESDIARNLAIYEYNFRDGQKVDTGKWPNSHLQISPRVGFVYDVFGDNTFKFRGGTGLFQGRLPLVYFTNMPTNAGLVQNSVQFKSTWDNGTLVSLNDKLHAFDGGMITNVNEAIDKLGLQKELTDANHVAGSTMSGVDPDFKMPQVWKTSVAFDWAVPVSFPFTVTGEGIFNKTIYGVTLDNININHSDTWDRFHGADNRLIYPADYLINAKKNAPVLTNTTKGYGYSANITLNATPVENLHLMAAYTYTESKEISGLPGSDPLSAWQGMITVDGPNNATLQRSQYVVPHKVIASVNYSIPFAFGGLKDVMEFSLFYTGASPYGYSYCYTNDMNGDGISNDLMYIYPNGASINWKDNADEQAKLYDAFVAQDRYLRNHKGQYAEAYAARATWVNRFDFRWAHNFKFNVGKTTHNFQLTADVLNIGNMFNSTWGVYKNNTISNNSRILKYEGMNAAGEPTFSLAKNANKDYVSQSYDYFVDRTQCWQVQFGLKYLFN